MTWLWAGAAHTEVPYLCAPAAEECAWVAPGLPLGPKLPEFMAQAWEAVAISLFHVLARYPTQPSSHLSVNSDQVC